MGFFCGFLIGSECQPCLQVFWCGLCQSWTGKTRLFLVFWAIFLRECFLSSFSCFDRFRSGFSWVLPHYPMDGNVSDVFWVLCVKCLGFFKDFAMWEVGWFVSLQKFLMIDGKSFFYWNDRFSNMQLEQSIKNCFFEIDWKSNWFLMFSANFFISWRPFVELF